jgi:ubiquinone/menaquinone biosynthesis C-methylase UbiE
VSRSGSSCGAGCSRLELVRTQLLIGRHLPPPPQVILDVGGGTGVYSRWLAGRGYEVHLIDPVPLHVAQAQQVSVREGEGPPASIRTGDARHLDQGDSTADAVLLLGPLYHLTESDERRLALGEARRVLRPGGLLFAAGISRFASLLDGLGRGLLEDPTFAAIVERDLRDGQHRNPTQNPAYFTTAYFHHPDELEAEVRRAGFAVQETVAVEGPGSLVPDFERWWDDPARRRRLLEAIRAVEHERSLLGVSAHLLVIGRKT